MSHGITRDAIDSQGGKAAGGAAKHNDPRLSKALADADKLRARVESVEAQLDTKLHAPRTTRPAPMLVIKNEDTGTYHRGVEAVDSCSAEWHSPCGWRYGLYRISRHKELPPGLSRFKICGRCLPFEKATADVPLDALSSESE